MLSQTIVIFAPFGTVEEGLNATLRLVIEPELENVTGEFFDGLNLSKANTQAYDRNVQQRLAALSWQPVSNFD
jgi:hypothetical protein